MRRAVADARAARRRRRARGARRRRGGRGRRAPRRRRTLPAAHGGGRLPLGARRVRGLPREAVARPRPRRRVVGDRGALRGGAGRRGLRRRRGAGGAARGVGHAPVRLRGGRGARGAVLRSGEGLRAPRRVPAPRVRPRARGGGRGPRLWPRRGGGRARGGRDGRRRRRGRRHRRRHLRRRGGLRRGGPDAAAVAAETRATRRRRAGEAPVPRVARRRGVGYGARRRPRRKVVLGGVPGQPGHREDDFHATVRVLAGGARRDALGQSRGGDGRRARARRRRRLRGADEEVLQGPAEVHSEGRRPGGGEAGPGLGQLRDRHVRRQGRHVRREARRPGRDQGAAAPRSRPAGGGRDALGGRGLPVGPRRLEHGPAHRRAPREGDGRARRPTRGRPRGLRQGDGRVPRVEPGPPVALPEGRGVSGLFRRRTRGRRGERVRAPLRVLPPRGREASADRRAAPGERTRRAGLRERARGRAPAGQRVGEANPTGGGLPERRRRPGRVRMVARGLARRADARHGRV
mmetsp:Transcript_4406/g.13982  ORF Transcript_4406/g.13982 Transcript_4406/m.13982 type:complete len:519 (-) Transcript_4406:1628-3184(-)